MGFTKSGGGVSCSWCPFDSKHATHNRKQQKRQQQRPPFPSTYLSLSLVLSLALSPICLFCSLFLVLCLSLALSLSLSLSLLCMSHRVYSGGGDSLRRRLDLPEWNGRIHVRLRVMPQSGCIRPLVECWDATSQRWSVHCWSVRSIRADGGMVPFAKHAKRDRARMLRGVPPLSHPKVGYIVLMALES